MDKEQLKNFRAVIKKEMDREYKARKKDLEFNLKAHMKDAQTCATQSNAYLKKAVSTNTAISLLAPKETAVFQDSLEKVLSSPFWEYSSFDEGVLCVNTRERIVMKEVNPAAGINRSVDLGFFQIKLTPMAGVIAAVPLKENSFALYGAPYICPHPFIGPTGNICWGTGTDLAHRLMSKQQYDKLFELLAGLLTSFEVGSTPYVRLSDLEIDRSRPRCKAGCGNSDKFCRCPGCRNCGKKNCQTCMECPTDPNKRNPCNYVYDKKLDHCPNCGFGNPTYQPDSRPTIGTVIDSLDYVPWNTSGPVMSRVSGPTDRPIRVNPTEESVF